MTATISCTAQLTDELMYEIRALTGQHYIDRYATKKAETLPTDVAKVRLSEPVEHERRARPHGSSRAPVEPAPVEQSHGSREPAPVGSLSL